MIVNEWDIIGTEHKLSQTNGMSWFNQTETSLRQTRRHNRTSTVADKWHVAVQSNRNLLQQTTYLRKPNTDVRTYPIPRSVLHHEKTCYLWGVAGWVLRRRESRIGCWRTTDFRIVLESNASVRTRATIFQFQAVDQEMTSTMDCPSKLGFVPPGIGELHIWSNIMVATLIQPFDIQLLHKQLFYHSKVHPQIPPTFHTLQAGLILSDYQVFMHHGRHDHNSMLPMIPFPSVR